MIKTIIIGAGPAGITAGYELLKQNSGSYDVTILEKGSEPGGLAKTVHCDGNLMDIGGHVFTSDNDNVIKWWEEILPQNGAPAIDDRLFKRDANLKLNGPDPEFEDPVMLGRKRYSEVYFNKKMFEYPVRINGATLRNLGMGNAGKAAISYFTGNIFKKKEHTLEDLYINCFGKQLYTMFFEGYIEKIWGRRPGQIIIDDIDTTVKGEYLADILREMAEESIHKEAGIREESIMKEYLYPKHGAGQMWEHAAREFIKMGGKILYNCDVKEIETEDGKVTGVKYLADGEEIFCEADILISSMPVKDLIAGMKDVPENISKIAGGLSYRDFVSIGVLVPELAIINISNIQTIGDVIPDSWIYVQDTDVKLSRIQIYNNRSPYTVARPKDSVWLGLEYYCNEGDYYWNMSDNKWKEYVKTELVKLGLIGRNTEIKSFRKDLVPKAFPSYFDTFGQFDEIIDYLDGFKNLYCIGRNGQHRCSNMDEVMGTSFEAVYNIINEIEDKTNIWRISSDVTASAEEEETVNAVEQASADEAHKAVNPALLEIAKEEIDRENKEKEEIEEASKNERKSFRKVIIDKTYRSFRKVPKELRESFDKLISSRDESKVSQVEEEPVQEETLSNPYQRPIPPVKTPFVPAPAVETAVTEQENPKPEPPRPSYQPPMGTSNPVPVRSTLPREETGSSLTRRTLKRIDTRGNQEDNTSVKEAIEKNIVRKEKSSDEKILVKAVEKPPIGRRTAVFNENAPLQPAYENILPGVNETEDDIARRTREEIELNVNAGIRAEENKAKDDAKQAELQASGITLIKQDSPASIWEEVARSEEAFSVKTKNETSEPFEEFDSFESIKSFDSLKTFEADKPTEPAIESKETAAPEIKVTETKAAEDNSAADKNAEVKKTESKEEAEVKKAESKEETEVKKTENKEAETKTAEIKVTATKSKVAKASKNYDEIVIPKDIFSKGKVIKSTTIVKNADEVVEPASASRKNTPKGEKVIAVIKDGVVVPVEKEAPKPARKRRTTTQKSKEEQ